MTEVYFFGLVKIERALSETDLPVSSSGLERTINRNKSKTTEIDALVYKWCELMGVREAT